MYSLAAKVVQVNEEKQTVKVKFRDHSEVEAKIEGSRKVMEGDYISIIGSVGEYKYETSGATFAPASEW